MDPNATYSFQLLGSEVQYLNSILSGKPYNDIAPLLTKLQAQLNAQLPSQ